MRKIKFRGKNLKSGEWFYGNLYDKDTVGRTHICTTDRGCLCINPDTVGQFTGLTDCNGKEIYEGDIISWISAMGRSARRIQGVVVWDQNTMSWSIARDIAITRSYTQHEVSRLAGKSPVEVIGNIHDNPELIE
ncbi:MAG: hypothetical protein K2J06_00900 [Muribaculaceae bacterium]|nr:hypothetical protein [Muribaculaceae bacterium]